EVGVAFPRPGDRGGPGPHDRLGWACDRRRPSAVFRGPGPVRGVRRRGRGFAPHLAQYGRLPRHTGELEPGPLDAAGPPGEVGGGRHEPLLLEGAPAIAIGFPLTAAGGRLAHRARAKPLRGRVEVVVGILQAAFLGGELVFVADDDCGPARAMLVVHNVVQAVLELRRRAGLRLRARWVEAQQLEGQAEGGRRKTLQSHPSLRRPPLAAPEPYASSRDFFLRNDGFSTCLRRRIAFGVTSTSSSSSM